MGDRATRRARTETKICARTWKYTRHGDGDGWDSREEARLYMKKKKGPYFHWDYGYMADQRAAKASLAEFDAREQVAEALTPE
jgi:hypothetical protein